MWWKLSLHLHLEALKRCESVLHFHWEVASGAKGAWNLHLTRLQRGSVSQPSYWVTAGPTRELNIYPHQDLYATPKKGNYLLREKTEYDPKPIK